MRVVKYPDGRAGMTAAEIFASPGHILTANGCHTLVIGNAGRGAWTARELAAAIAEETAAGEEPCPYGEECEHCRGGAA